MKKVSIFALLLVMLMGSGLWAQSSASGGRQKAAPAVQNFTLNVVCNVGNARIFVDGKESKGGGWSLPGGTYAILVRAPGYQEYNASIQLNSDQTFNVNLVADSYSLTVTSNVKGAQVAISNGLNGQTGQTFSLPGGSYTITVSAAGFQAFSTSIQLNGNQTVNANLTPVTFNLTVQSNVKGAQVSISNGLNGQTGQSFSLPGGTYSIRVSAAGYQDFNTSIQLSSDQVIKADLALMTGTLVFDMPKGSALQLFVDGSIVNFAKGNNNAMALIAGPHKVRVEVGFIAAETQVNIIAGQTVTVSPLLSILVK